MHTFGETLLELTLKSKIKGTLTLGPVTLYHAKARLFPSPVPRWPALTLLQGHPGLSTVTSCTYVTTS